MASRGARVVGRIFSWLIVIALVAAGVFAWVNWQWVDDTFQAFTARPTAEVVRIADRIELTGDGERVFYASHPALEEGEAFNESCADVPIAEGDHVLGCYADKEIFLFRVTDERLDGVVEVTAAHELLHAVYARFSAGERDTIDAAVAAEYERVTAEDPELAERMSVYDELAGASFANEMFAVMGTEVGGLNERLESTYGRWFADRDVVVSLYDSYHSVFTELQEQADALEAELDQMFTDIEAQKAQYDADLAQYNADVESFNARNEAYEFSGNPDEFSRLRNELEQRRSGLNASLESINANVESYNAKREELIALGRESEDLNAQLDSSAPPPEIATE